MIELVGLPPKSRLLMIGDWYKKNRDCWRVVCYFLAGDNTAFRKGLPIDLLPILVIGKVYNDEDEYTYDFTRLPKSILCPVLSSWQLFTYADIPLHLKHATEFDDELSTQLVYRITDRKRTFWVPVIEIARKLFFQTSELTRTAIYEGNTHQIAKTECLNSVAKITFSSNVPNALLKNKVFIKFLTWLVLSERASKSFSSIFLHFNRNVRTQESDKIQKWTFNFDLPFDLVNTELTAKCYSGQDITGIQRDSFVEEINGVHGISLPHFDFIEYSHANDSASTLITKKRGKSDKHSIAELEPKINVTSLEMENNAKSTGAVSLLKGDSSYFDFNTEIDIRRKPKETRILQLASAPADLNENANSVSVSLKSDYGKSASADFDILSESKLFEASQKFSLFQEMLKRLEIDEKWSVVTEIKRVPRENCRKKHVINGSHRHYCSAIIKISPENFVGMLEIELAPNEALSTLIYRARNYSETINYLLKGLMSSNSLQNKSSLQWDRRINRVKTESLDYLDHPVNFESVKDVLNSWCNRAKNRIYGL